jgi:hypothetical protein
MAGPTLPMDGFFETLRDACGEDGSELEAGITYFSLALSIRAANIVEIGRNTGFSTYAFASALRLLDEPSWLTPKPGFRERPDVDYAVHDGPRKRTLFSVEISPKQEAYDLIERQGLTRYVKFVNQPSLRCPIPDVPIDVLLVDGNHEFEACTFDVDRWLPCVRPGGYMLLHDFYGWYGGGTENRSPIKHVADNLRHSRLTEALLVDTGYCSPIIFRKPL